MFVSRDEVIHQPVFGSVARFIQSAHCAVPPSNPGFKIIYCGLKVSSSFLLVKVMFSDQFFVECNRMRDASQIAAI